MSFRGNYGGQPIYKEGQACSECPSTHSGCNDGLCSKGGGSNNNAPSPAKATTKATWMNQAQGKVTTKKVIITVGPPTSSGEGKISSYTRCVYLCSFLHTMCSPVLHTVCSPVPQNEHPNFNTL